MSKDNTKNHSEEEKLREEAESGERVSGEPDSNLSAIGGGAIAGGAVGAAIGGAIGGAVGSAIGGTVGAVAGAAVADQIQDELDPKLEEVYWQENYQNRPYYQSGKKYEDYLPAYRFGWEAATRREFADRTFEQLEPELKNTWQSEHSASGDWESVRPIVHDAFIRIREKRHKVGL